MEPFAIHHDLFIKVDASKVYEAVSDPSHLINWWPLKCTGKATDGASYNFYFTPKYNWYGVVTKSEANRHCHIKMTRSDEDWNGTSFGFDLEGISEGTQVKFWHVGWPACNHHFRRSSYCWAILLKGLKDYLERGIIVPFEERE